VTGVQSSYTWAIILWLQVTASSRTGADLATLLGSFGSALSSNIMPTLVSTCSVTEIKGVWITPGGGEITGSDTTLRNGTVAPPALPNLATCAVLNWRIDQYYRGGKPRTYLPGVPEANTTDFVHLTTTALSNYQTKAAAFRTAVNAITAGAITAVKIGTISFQQHKQWRDTPVFFPYNGVSVRSVMGIQRRRLLT